jgi:PadR family transcriptional regulator, regulatory protein PadR
MTERAPGRPVEERSAFDEAKRGSAELLILALVENDSLHGYEIGRQIELRSDGTLTFTLAALYATLYRMEARRWISGRWIERAGQRRRRHYRITESGRKVLAAQREDWARLIGVLGQVAGVRYA